MMADFRLRRWTVRLAEHSGIRYTNRSDRSGCDGPPLRSEDSRMAYPRLWRRASRQRAFSEGVPTVMRIHSGS